MKSFHLINRFVWARKQYGGRTRENVILVLKFIFVGYLLLIILKVLNILGVYVILLI